MKDTLAAPVIEAKGVNLVFETGDGPVQALKDVDLAIGRGEFVSVHRAKWLWENDFSAGDCGFGGADLGGSDG